MPWQASQLLCLVAALKSGYISRDPSLEILCDARLPPEVAWHILKFWRVTGEATGDII